MTDLVPFAALRAAHHTRRHTRGDMAAPAQTAPATTPSTEFIRGIGPLAAVSLVVGSMIGSGIFIVSADIGRQVSPWGPGGLLLVWVITGLVTVVGALSYAVLRIPRGEHLVQGREDVMAAIGPDDIYDRGEAVWLDIRGNRFTLFDQESGRTIA